MPASRDEMRSEMRRLGRERDRARERAVELTRELAPLVIQAYDDDMTVREICELSGLSREAVYVILRKRG